ILRVNAFLNEFTSNICQLRHRLHLRLHAIALPHALAIETLIPAYAMLIQRLFAGLCTKLSTKWTEAGLKSSYAAGQAANTPQRHSRCGFSTKLPSYPALIPGLRTSLSHVY
ncbi:hypothetical protein, partial [Janthinobacterium sp. CG_23.3]|uniref:hypothetical protein n=1 Tax=Janthinobacterium sp. CG_23.3 TaxID=3349634 RepID=UPI0038D4E59A